MHPSSSIQQVLIMALASFLATATTDACPPENRTTTTPLPKLDGRILGGTNTMIQNHPHQLSLEYYGKHICGASLITPTKALTAAQCTQGVTSNTLAIRAGSSYSESGGQLIPINSICQDPRFDFHGGTLDYDSAVLNLAYPVTLNQNVNTIKLLQPGMEVPTGAFATVTGWGSIHEGGSVSTYLQQLFVPKVDDHHCSDMYGNAVTPRMVCFGYLEGGSGPCSGDTGSPLVYAGFQVGIMSWGYGCGRPYYPQVYTKLSDRSVQEHIMNC